MGPQQPTTRQPAAVTPRRPAASANSEGFSDFATAHRWLCRPAAALSGHAPLDLLDIEIEARQVEMFLGRVTHGIAIRLWRGRCLTCSVLTYSNRNTR
ncbi:MAG: antitoxin Xre/MbcA/ParS toxin-binding domain-containing protein [Janthinobacterium lividum]